MANIILLLYYYLKYWAIETRLFYGLFQAHFFIFLFSFFIKDLSFLIIPILLAFIMQLYYSDWGLKDFYVILNINPIHRHYSKIILLNGVCLSLILHFTITNKQNVLASLVTLILWSLLFGICYAIKSKFLSSILFVGIFSISSFISLKIDSYLVHCALIIGLVVLNGFLYFKNIKSYI